MGLVAKAGAARAGVRRARVLSGGRAPAARPALARPARHVAARAEDKKLTRDAEPAEAWLSKGEKEGANPLADPMAIAAIVGLVVPFTILAIGIASGYIEVQ